MKRCVDSTQQCLGIFLLVWAMISHTNGVYAQSGGTSPPDSCNISPSFDQRPWLHSLPCPLAKRNAHETIQPEQLAKLRPQIDKRQIWNFERKSRIRHYDRRAPLSGKPTNKSPIAFVVQLSAKILNNLIHPNQKQPIIDLSKVRK